jgi:ferritin
MKETTNNITNLYETGVEDIVRNFQDSLIDNRDEREKVKIGLRESLAKNESLRRKDFDSMMKEILLTQDEKENEARHLLNSYLNEQEETVNTLKSHLTEVRDALDKGEAIRVKEYQEMLQRILDEQEERKTEVASKLKTFQQEQQKMIMGLKDLLARERGFRIKDLKSLLNEFKTQREERMIKYGERIARREERRMEVINMLQEFRSSRLYKEV